MGFPASFPQRNGRTVSVIVNGWPAKIVKKNCKNLNLKKRKRNIYQDTNHLMIGLFCMLVLVDKCPFCSSLLVVDIANFRDKRLLHTDLCTGKLDNHFWGS